VSDPPAFGATLRKLLERRQLSVRDLPEPPGAPDLGEAPDGWQPGSSFLRQMAPVLGLHAADLFVIAGLRVPDDLAPVDGTAGWRAVMAAGRLVRLLPPDRGRLLEFARSLPQAVRAEALPQAREQYPAGFGGMLLGLLSNRNLRLPDVAKAVAILTRGRVYFSAPAYDVVGRGAKEITPEVLDGIAAVLDIPSGDLAALGDISLPPVPASADPAVADAAALIWEARRLTAGQVQQVRDLADSLSSQ
jgi:hypothetical protein